MQETEALLNQIYNLTKMKDYAAQRMEKKGKEIFNDAKEIADKVFHVLEVKPTLPVDIRGLVEKCGIRVYETNLNADMGFQIERINGYLKKRGENWCIFLEAKDSELMKRYVLAHELSHFLIDNAKTYWKIEHDLEERHCIDPLFSKDWDELMSDILASFILFPPKAVLEYLSWYEGELRDKNVYPMDSYEWLRVLGHMAQVSTYFTIISYQYLKFYMCDQYEKRDKEESSLAIEFKRYFK